MQSTSTSIAKAKGTQKKNRTPDELLDLIEQCVATDDIARAEQLREELMQWDTIPLNQIIASANLIEDAKLAGIDGAHQLLWIDLYDCLTPEEKSLLYYSLEDRIIPAKTVFLRQGQVSNGLFFIEDGHVNAVFTKEKENNLVLQITKGGFFGEDNFFGMSVCTSSFVSRSALSVKFLGRNRTVQWEIECPGLFAKLESYCKRFGQYEELYERKRSEKSRFKRLSAQGKVCADILSSDMKLTGKQFKARVDDISRGGACLFIKASRREAARFLLGRPLRMAFSLETNRGVREIVAFGRVVRVKFHLENDYSVHVKFAKTLGPDTLEEMLAK